MKKQVSTFFQEKVRQETKESPEVKRESARQADSRKVNLQESQVAEWGWPPDRKGFQVAREDRSAKKRVQLEDQLEKKERAAEQQEKAAEQIAQLKVQLEQKRDQLKYQLAEWVNQLAVQLEQGKKSARSEKQLEDQLRGQQKAAEKEKPAG
jgi:hypothetical protein